jgi:hypothetical protein
LAKRLFFKNTQESFITFFKYLPFCKSTQTQPKLMQLYFFIPDKKYTKLNFFAEPGIAFSVEKAENGPLKKARMASFISKTNGFEFDASQAEYKDIEFIQV